jgi:[acyl-carrier-protein] S-malonyltransferase
MPRTAWIFPGQGSQYVGMGRDLAEAFPASAEVFRQAGEVLGFDLAAVCFDGPEEKLRETRFTQVAILTHSVAVLRAIEGKADRPAYVAGHSVGEYAALVAGGALVFEDALRLVRARAEAMHASGLERPGAMAALVGMPEGNLEALIKEAGAAGVVRAANYNSPVQVVISGETAAVDAAVKAAPSFGVKRAIRLNVSGAFHSPLMEGAQAALRGALASARFARAAIPVVSNVTAGAASDPAEIAGLLERQLTSPVKWRQSVEFMAAEGVGSFVEVGPGNVLAGLVKRIAPSAECVSLSDAAGVKAFLQGGRT